MPRPAPDQLTVVLASDLVRRAAGGAVLVAAAFAQDPRLVVADTKLDLVVDPGGFLARSLQAWDPQAAFGQLQNQAYGYLFPMGPFFWLGDVLGLPVWVVQRLWWVVLLLAAYSGFLRLAGLLGAGTPTTRVVGALAYALGPRVLSELGPISSEVLPLVMLPWVLAPLVTGSRSGSPRRAAAWSALAVVAMGGVNAAATLAVLVLPLLFLLTRQRGPRRHRLLAWWLGLLPLAVAWWFLPLLVLGSYAYPFLDYIESARVTAQATSVTNVLRGTEHWLAYLVVRDGSLWRSGFWLATSVAGIVATVVTAGLGLAGIADRRTPERRFLAWGVVAGLVLAGIAYAGEGGSVVAGPVQDLLDGPLAPFRNMHKFDPVLRLPIAIGLTVLLARAPAAGRRLLAQVPGEDGRWLRERPAWGTATIGVLIVLPLVVSLLPAVQGTIPPRGSFLGIPPWWVETARWLEVNDAEGRALLEPATTFGEYTWGRTADEPLQPLARSPWAVRNAVPLGAPGATRLLDAVEAELALGRRSDGLAPALARAGVRYVVLRHDVDPLAAASPPVVVRATLEASPGLRRVATFGPLVSSGLGLTLDAVRAVPPRPAVEVYELATAGDPRARTVPLSQTATLVGGPEATVAAAALDVLPAALVAEADGGSGSALVSDTLRRRRLNTGADATRNYSETLRADEDAAQGRPAADVTPYDGVDRQTTAAPTLDGRPVRIDVSSSGADPFARVYRGPVARAGSAVDGDPSTAWLSDVGDAAPWWRLDLPEPRAPARVVITLAAGPGVARPAEIEVRTDLGRTVAAVPGDGRVVVPVDGATTTLRVTLRRAAGREPTAMGIAEVDIPGLRVRQTLALPAVAARVDVGALVLEREPRARRECLRTGGQWLCAHSLGRAAEEPDLDRTVESARGLTGRIDAWAEPTPGPVLDRLLDAALLPWATSVSASGREFDDPAARPGAALDGDRSTAWVTRRGDTAPALTVTTAAPVTLSRIGLLVDAAGRDSVRNVVVSSGSERREVPLRPSRVAAFEPLTGRRFTVTLRLAAGASDVPLVVDELYLPGLPQPVPAVDATIDQPCGRGPAVALDGRVVPTALRVSAERLLEGGRIPLRVCAPEVVLGAGRHDIVAGAGGGVGVVAVSVHRALAVGGAPSGRGVDVLQWEPEHRTVRVEPGEESLLVLAEGYNRGWRASARGQRLEPVRVDGWRQAFRLPAGAVGEVELTFSPGRLHRAGLGVGALLVLLLGALALTRGGVGPPAVGPGVAPRVERELLALIPAVVLAGPVGLAGWLVGRSLATRAVRWIPGGAVLLAGVAAAPTGWPDLGERVVTAARFATQGLALALVVAAVSAATVPRRLPDSSRARDGAPTGGPDARPATTTPWPPRR